MKKFLLSFVLCLIAITTVNAQSILADWEGAYEGEMIIGNTNPSRPNDTAKVTFELTPLIEDLTWTYKMTYLSDKYGTIVKDYQLTRVGESKVDFLLDENDGIIIEMSLMNDCFYSMFEVMDNIYSTSLRKSGDNIQFDLFSSNMKKGTITENEAEDPDDIFEVTSYKPMLHQTILFTKKDVVDDMSEADKKAYQAYEKLVEAADEAYEEENFERAFELYSRATRLNPSDSYAKERMLKSQEKVK